MLTHSQGEFYKPLFLGREQYYFGL